MIQACKDYLCKLLAYGILFSQLKVAGMICGYLLALNIIAILVCVYRYVVGRSIVFACYVIRRIRVESQSNC